MEELSTLVERSRAGDLSAYSALVRRFQDMAVGYAQALTHDFHLAEDAAQEAFVRAYLDLGKLREPAAFPGWFRRIVFKQCDRITRRKGLPAVSLETVGEIGADGRMPDDLLEEQEIEDRVTSAVQSLPEHQRLVVNLFYINEIPHREIAAFLGLSVQTVKNRLHAARKRLRQELIDMARKKLQEQRPSRDDTFVTHIMDELAGLSDRGIQYLLRLTDQKDCVVALKGASDDLLKKRMHLLLREQETRYRMIIEGIELLQTRHLPAWVRRQLRARYTLEEE